MHRFLLDRNEIIRSVLTDVGASCASRTVAPHAQERVYVRCGDTRPIYEPGRPTHEVGGRPGFASQVEHLCRRTNEWVWANTWLERQERAALILPAPLSPIPLSRRPLFSSRAFPPPRNRNDSWFRKANYTSSRIGFRQWTRHSISRHPFFSMGGGMGNINSHVTCIAIHTILNYSRTIQFNSCELLSRPINICNGEWILSQTNI